MIEALVFNARHRTDSHDNETNERETNGKSMHKGWIFFFARCGSRFNERGREGETCGITTTYQKCGTINLERIGLIEKRFVRASACLFVGMSDIVGHGPSEWALECGTHTTRYIPFIRKHAYTWPLTHATDSSSINDGHQTNSIPVFSINKAPNLFFSFPIFSFLLLSSRGVVRESTIFSIC